MELEPDQVIETRLESVERYAPLGGGEFRLGGHHGEVGEDGGALGGECGKEIGVDGSLEHVEGDVCRFAAGRIPGDHLGGGQRGGRLDRRDLGPDGGEPAGSRDGVGGVALDDVAGDGLRGGVNLEAVIAEWEGGGEGGFGGVDAVGRLERL